MSFFRKKSQVRKARISALLFFFSFAIVTSALFAAPRPVSAQIPVTDAAVQAQLSTLNTSVSNVSSQTTSTNIFTQVKDIAVEAATMAVVNAASFFSQQIAYSLAVSLTSDCPGQKPCWDSKAFLDGFNQAWKGAVGEAVGTFSEQAGFDRLGFNLCKPAIPGVTLKIQLGLLQGMSDKPKPPRCDFDQIVSNYKDFAGSLNTRDLLKKVSIQFEPGQSPLSVTLRVNDRIEKTILDKQTEAIVKKLADAAAGGGFGDVIDPVTKRIKTPAIAVKEEFLRAEREKKDKPKENAALYTAGSIARGAVVTVVLTAVQVFVQTLLSRMLDKLMKSGLLSAADLIAAQPDLIFSAEGLLQPIGVEGAKIAQSGYLAPAPQQAGVIDPLLEFSTCPANADFRSMNNCVLDSQFAAAVRAGEGVAMTVSEALEKNLLHKDWQLISSKDVAKDRDYTCYGYGYCESNLKKMRAARIVPIGWEIAASLSPTNSPVTLGTAVSRFNDCNEQGERDDAHPWCHLIDPDWTLKQPLTQCKAQVFGPQFISPNTPDRKEVCVDAPTCIKQDDTGNCIGGWGYCSREKNVWRFGGDACPSQYNSCRSLRPRSAPEKPVNFLLNTLEYGVCNSGNAGCQSYALSLNAGSCTLGSACVEATAGAGCPCPASGAAKQCTVLNGQSTCTTLTGVETDKGDDWQATPARYFNKDVEKCNTTGVGCTQLVRLAANQTLNLVKNGSFEELEDADGDGSPDHARYWTPFGSAPATGIGFVSADGTKATSGRNAILAQGTAAASQQCSLGSACTSSEGCPCSASGFSCKVVEGEKTCKLASSVQQGLIPIRPGVTYTVSASFRNPGAAANGELSLTFTDAAGSDVAVPTSASLSGLENATCTRASNPSRIRIQAAAGSFEQKKLGCTFLITQPASAKPITHAAITLSGSGYADEVQLEEGGGTPYHEAYGGDVELLNVKIAPDYLGCTGAPNDRPECASFAGVCREQDLGCKAYVPKNGDPMIPGIVSAQDSCPAECVGYDIYKQEATPFDQEKFPVYFIPSSASRCAATDVGCSEFTNVDTEQVEYYSGLRACQKPTEADTTTYYSWEGSDTTGYELRIWNLKASDAAAAHIADGSDISANASAANGSPAGIAPCTVYNGTDATCDDQAAPNSRALCSRADIVAGNFDCREFYDTNGNRHYRLLSKTIIATDACNFYRPTVSTETDCLATSGKWNPDRSECVYAAAPTESRACTREVNGCRAYKGNAAGNVRTIMNDDFEQAVADVAEWGTQSGSSSAVAPTANVVNSNESVTVGGHSLRLVAGTRGAKDVTALVATGRSYTLSFWAKGQGNVAIYFQKAGQETQGQGRFSVDDNVAATPTVTLTGGWQQYAVGPVSVADPAWTATPVLLVIDPSNGNADAYLDNIIFKEVQDNIYIVRDSWRTPASCDQTAEGTPSPLEMLGCRAYRSENQDVNLRSFSQLCRENAIGCRAYANTSNTQNPYQETYNAVCVLPQTCAGGATCPCNYDTPSSKGFQRLGDVCRVVQGERSCRFKLDDWDLSTNPGGTTDDRVRIPADQRLFLVVKSNNLCSEQMLGCKNLGTPKIVYQGSCTMPLDGSGNPTTCTQANGCSCTDSRTNKSCTVKQGAVKCTYAHPEGIIESWSAATVKDNPAKYEQTLCTAAAVRCEEYTSTSGSVYFKDPGDKTCSYQVDANVLADPADPNSGFVTRSGWFQKNESGETFPCYPDLLRAGQEFQIAKNSDQEYQGWVGSCEAKYDSCEEFVDPSDTTEAHPKGQPYFYLQNSKLDTQSCAGTVGLKKGCVLFQKTSDTRTIYSSEATYEKSEQQNNSAVGPVDCAANPNLDLCRSNGNVRANNTNTIIKVRRDRECGEWLSCTSTTTVIDPATNQPKEVCSELRTCNQLLNTNVETARCASFPSSVGRNKLLTVADYVGRGLTWKDGDYAGYSIPGMFPVEFLTQVNVAGICSKSKTPCSSKADCPAPGGQYCVANTDDPEMRLAHLVPDSGSECRFDENGETCFANAGDPTSKGTCYDSKCVQLPRTSSIDSAVADQTAYAEVAAFDPGARVQSAVSCRAYPEKTSPVPPTVVSEWNQHIFNGAEYTESGADTDPSETVQWTPTSWDPKFAGANICQYVKNDKGIVKQCECQYTKATYGKNSHVKYLPAGSRSVAKPFVCAGGESDGAACIPPATGETDMCSGGKCTPLAKLEVATGITGYCLERDLMTTLNGESDNHACALWLPNDALTGSLDIYNNDERAGFVPPEDNLYYCAESQGRSLPDGRGSTAQPYVNVFIDETKTATQGFICTDKPGGGNAGACANYTSEKACNNRSPVWPPGNPFNMHACTWSSGSCKPVFLPIPRLTLPPSFGGCLNTAGLKDREGRDIGSQITFNSAELYPGQPTDRPPCADDDRCVFLAPSKNGQPPFAAKGTTPPDGNECYARCSISVPKRDFCVETKMGQDCVKKIDPDGGGDLPEVCVFYVPHFEIKSWDCNTPKEDGWELQRFNDVPVGLPFPDCDMKLTNCCLPKIGDNSVISGLITQATNTNPSSYKVCEDDPDKFPQSCSSFDPSIPINSCKTLDDAILIGTIATLTAPLTAVGGAGAGGGSYYGYLSAALGPIAGVIQAGVGASVVATAFGKCFDLAVAGVCEVIPTLDRYIFTAINNPIANLGPDFLPSPTPPKGVYGFQGASGPRISPRLGTIPQPGDVLDPKALLNNFSETGYKLQSPISANLPPNVRREEIAAIRVTAVDPPQGGLLDATQLTDPNILKLLKMGEQTKAVPRVFYLMPPNFEASFWWNGGDDEDTNATEKGKAAFKTDFLAACGDPGVACNDVANATRTCTLTSACTDEAGCVCSKKPSTLAPQNDGYSCRVAKGSSSCKARKTCEYFFTEDQTCMELQPKIDKNNTGVENCAAIKAVFAKHCSNNPLQACEQNSDCHVKFGPLDVDNSATCDGNANTFQGFKSGMCIRSSMFGGQLPVKIEILMREMCNVVAQTAKASDSASVPKSVAYTDRVWEGSKPNYEIVQNEAFRDSTTVPLLSNEKVTANTDRFFPFGVLFMKGESLKQPITLYRTDAQPGKAFPTPYTHFKPEKPEEPPVKLNLDLTKPVGGYTYGCAPNATENSPIQPPRVYLDQAFGVLRNVVINAVASSLAIVKDTLTRTCDGGPNDGVICFVNAQCGGGNGCVFGSGPGKLKICVGDTGAANRASTDGLVCNTNDECGGGTGRCVVPTLDDFANGIKDAFTLNAPRSSCDTLRPQPSADLNTTDNLTSDVDTAAEARRSLNQIFAKVYGTLRWNERGAYDAPEVDGNGNPVIPDVRSPDYQHGSLNGMGPFDDNAFAPRIYPIRSESCATDGKCQADVGNPGSFTLNGQNSGTVFVDSANKAVVQFFFEADKNHMPARKIVIDWGDKMDASDLTVMNGLYKNHVGVYPDGSSGCDADQGRCSNKQSAACSDNSDCGKRCADDEKVSCSADADCRRNLGPCTAYSGSDAAKQGKRYCSKQDTKECSIDQDCLLDLGACSNDYGVCQNPKHCAATANCTLANGCANKACNNDSQCETSGKCVQTGFGRSSRACTDSYMEFSHIYVCDPQASFGTDISAGQPVKDATGTVCRFRPRVMVMDNWGWCNGSCVNDGANRPSSPICFNYGPSSNQCDESAASSPGGLYPWSAFDGEIQVIAE